MHLIPLGLSAQSNVREQSLYWFGYFATLDLNARWFAVGEFQERRWTDPVRVPQRVWRGHPHRRLSPTLTAGGGFTYFLQGVQSPASAPLPLVAALRPHLQLDLRQPLTSAVNLSHRARLESRATPRTANGIVTQGYESAGRLRYRVGADYRLNPDRADTLVFRLSDEVHVMFGDRPLSRLFDQNREHGGALIPLSESCSAEGAYLWWYQRRRDGVLYDRDIWRVIFHHRLRRVRG